MGDRVTAAPPERELFALIHLSLLPGVGDLRLAALRRSFGSAAAAVAADLEAFRRVAGDRAAEMRGAPEVRQCAERALRAIGEEKLVVRIADGPGYPPALCQLHDPPQLLFLRGEEGLLAEPCVAIVGARHATEYGLRSAAAIARRMAAHGIVVVSGLAFGIDQAAHEAVLAAGGATIAVLGSGADVAHPPSNRGLMARIATRGLLLSEFLPGEPALRHHFPRRNRIMAALSRAVVVVEASARSGALITVDHALDLGRDVFAVPGPIDRPQSAGTNGLIRDGAHIVTRPDDVVEALGWTARRAWADADGADATDGGGARDPAAAPGRDAHRVWRALDVDPLDIDEVARRARLDVRRVLAALSALELTGDVVQHAGKRFARASGADGGG